MTPFTCRDCWADIHSAQQGRVTRTILNTLIETAIAYS